jgi:hypothetical protein
VLAVACLATLGVLRLKVRNLRAVLIKKVFYFSERTVVADIER